MQACPESLSARGRPAPPRLRPSPAPARFTAGPLAASALVIGAISAGCVATGGDDPSDPSDPAGPREADESERATLTAGVTRTGPDLGAVASPPAVGAPPSPVADLTAALRHGAVELGVVEVAAIEPQADGSSWIRDQRGGAPIRLEPGYSCWFPMPAVGDRIAFLIDPRRTRSAYRTILHPRVGEPVAFAVASDRSIQYRGERVDLETLAAFQRSVTR